MGIQYLRYLTQIHQIHIEQERIKYLSVGPNAEHEQAMQLIFEHCDGTYTELNRVDLRGYTTVDAECALGTESLP